MACNSEGLCFEEVTKEGSKCCNQQSIRVARDFETEECPINEVFASWNFSLSTEHGAHVTKFLQQFGAASANIGNTLGCEFQKVHTGFGMEQEQRDSCEAGKDRGSSITDCSIPTEDAVYSNCFASIEKLSHTGVTARKALAALPGMPLALTRALHRAQPCSTHSASAVVGTSVDRDRRSILERKSALERTRARKVFPSTDQERALRLLAEMGPMWRHHLTTPSHAEIVDPTIQALLSGLVRSLETAVRGRHGGYRTISHAAQVLAHAVHVMAVALDGRLLECSAMLEHIRLALKLLVEYLDALPDSWELDPFLSGKHNVLEGLQSIQISYGRPIVLSPPNQTIHPNKLGEDVVLMAKPLSEAIWRNSRNGGTAQAAEPVLGIHWMKDGGEIPGCTTSSLTLQNVSPKAAGAYACVLSNSAGETTFPINVACPPRKCCVCADEITKTTGDIRPCSYADFCCGGMQWPTGFPEFVNVLTPNFLQFTRAGTAFVFAPPSEEWNTADEMDCFFRFHGNGSQICGVAIPSDAEQQLGQDEKSWGLLRIGNALSILHAGEWTRLARQWVPQFAPLLAPALSDRDALKGLAIGCAPDVH